MCACARASITVWCHPTGVSTGTMLDAHHYGIVAFHRLNVWYKLSTLEHQPGYSQVSFSKRHLGRSYLRCHHCTNATVFNRYVDNMLLVSFYIPNLLYVCLYHMICIPTWTLTVWFVFQFEGMHNQCATNPCKNGGTCTSSKSSYACNCLKGYTGINCESKYNRPMQ